MATMTGTGTGTGPGSRLGSRLAHWRGGRLLHPRGRSFTGEVELWGPFVETVLGAPGRRAVLVRLSRGTPTPEGWPDLLGLGVRISGPPGPFDLLVSSSGRLPVLRHLPLPRRDFAGPYSGILSYRLGGRRVYLAALPEHPLGRTLDTVVAVAARGEGRFLLAVASVFGRWQPFGRIIFGDPLPVAVDAALAFNPFEHHPPALRMVGLIKRIRVGVYAASQRYRGAYADQSVLPGW